MLLTNEFVVAADLDTVWRHLLDMEEVAKCVPGAKVEEVAPPNTYRGKIRLKIGPMTVEYRGEATLLEVDEDARRATIQMKAREARGQGSALATVRNSLAMVPEGTRVRAETELEITGPQAQFGKGVLEDIGSRILEEFTLRLERSIAFEESEHLETSQTKLSHSGIPPIWQQSNNEGPRLENESLDLGEVVLSSLWQTNVKIGLATIATLFIIIMTWHLRRRKQPSE